MDHKCKKCNKNYASYKSLWNHTKLYHTILNDIIPPIHATESSIPAKLHLEKSINTDNLNITCEYCKMIFTRKDSLKKHYNRCKTRLYNDNKLKVENDLLKQQLKEQDNKLKEEVDNVKKEFEKEIIIMKKQMLEIMNKQNKIH